MEYLIDWLSFGLDVTGSEDVIGHMAYRHYLDQLADCLGTDIAKVLYPGEWELRAGRAPFSHAIVSRETNCHLFVSTKLPYALVECSGKTCDAIRQAGHERDILEIVCNETTRIDVSCDITSSVCPISFSQDRDQSRFRTTGRFESSSGTTVYIGSPTSDRRACIYRYHAPHPRAGRLRVEHRFRRDRAVEMARYILRAGVPSAVAQCGQIFGWMHPIWNTGDLVPSPMTGINSKVSQNGTLHWLQTQVIPAIKTLQEDGVLDDPVAWLDDMLHGDHGR